MVVSRAGKKAAVLVVLMVARMAVLKADMKVGLKVGLLDVKKVDRWVVY